MPTTLNYFDDSYVFSGSAVVTSQGNDDFGAFVILDCTLFHPQGGGQPFDVGSIEVNDTCAEVVAVKWVQGEVRHYLKTTQADLLGKKVLLTVDETKRRQHARLHSGGHILSLAVETIYPQLKATKGHHFPDGPYVEFTRGEKEYANVDLQLVNDQVKDLVAQNLPFSSVLEGETRMVRFGSFAFQPCGGTHVRNTSELFGIVATHQKQKGNILKIKYT